jgi:glycosyltransferase involved in cell wall biosynthesis
MPAPVLLDATPLASAHAVRGIGASVAGMLRGFAAMPAEARPDLLALPGQRVPQGFAARRIPWPRWRLHRLPDPWPVLAGERLARRRAGRRVFHATQPALMPDGPGVATCHDLIPACFPREYLAGPGRTAERLAYRRYLRHLRAAALVMAPSRETADDVVRIAGVDRGRVRVVPWAAPEPAGVEGEAPPGRYVLFAGALEPHKNAHVAVEAIARASPGVRLVMAGPWSSRRAERLRRHAGRVGAAGRVEWLGLLTPSRLAAVRAGALAVLVPSRKEGFGFPVLEGMASEVPVLAADIPALREVGGDAARYIAPDRPADWARAIDEVAGDRTLRADLVERGRTRIAAFSWEETARRVAEAYAEAAG